MKKKTQTKLEAFTKITNNVEYYEENGKIFRISLIPNIFVDAITHKESIGWRSDNEPTVEVLIDQVPVIGF